MLHEYTIGDRIQELREDHDLTQKAFAKAINVSRGKLSQWECGARSPGVSDIEVIADVFGTTTDWLIRGIRPENTEIHAATSLSDEAIQTLRIFKDNDPTGMKTAALSQALSSGSVLDGLSSLLMVQSDERGYHEATCSPEDGFYKVEMSPDSFAAAIGIRLLLTLEAIRTGNKAPIQPYPPAERRTKALTEKLIAEKRLLTNEQASKR